MAKAKSIIAPLPAAIDRRDFGNYLSGFVDGEAYFGLIRDTPVKTRDRQFSLGY